MQDLIRLILNIFDFFTQRKILKAISTRIKENKLKILLDVGSHKGEYISSLNSRFFINETFGFEPNPDIYDILNKRFNSQKIKLFNYGISHNSGIISLNKNIETSSSSINELNSKSKYYKKKYFLLNFLSSKKITSKIDVKVKRLDEFLNEYNINEVDLLKIDTEGFEYKVLQSLGSDISKIKIIHFEHHFDDMIIKNYKLSDIHNLLIKNEFEKYFKIKMKFRKSFEYVYINKKFKT